jgi:hypothetical protein
MVRLSCRRLVRQLDSFASIVWTREFIPRRPVDLTTPFTLRQARGIKGPAALMLPWIELLL